MSKRNVSDMAYQESTEITLSQLREIVESMEITVLLVIDFPRVKGETEDE